MNKYFKAAAAILFFIMAFILLFIVLHRHEKKVKIKARIAIVLDDWGYYSSTLPLLHEIRRPITIAILPNHTYSRQVAAYAQKNGYQTILHLPLESRNNKGAEEDTLYCAMDENQMREQLERLIRIVPGISGVNNHQGSQATENARMMEIILTELNKEKLFFLDSLTTSGSVCSQVAKHVGIRFAKRDVFLDTPPDRLDEDRLRAYIARQLDQLAGIAMKRGYAVGIGHDREVTLSVLKESMPLLEKEGIKFVFLSELVK